MDSRTISFITLAVLAVLLVALPDNVNGLCCRADAVGRCGDNSVGTPCCGHGKCNIFCCSCSGGCRDPTSNDKIETFFKKARSTKTGTDIVAAADVNSDNVLSFTEAEEYLALAGRCGTHTSLEELDVNKDGLLSAEEIDRIIQ